MLRAAQPEPGCRPKPQPRYELYVLRSHIFQYAARGLEYIQCRRCESNVLQCCRLRSRHGRVGVLCGADLVVGMSDERGPPRSIRCNGMLEGVCEWLCNVPWACL